MTNRWRIQVRGRSQVTLVTAEELDFESGCLGPGETVTRPLRGRCVFVIVKDKSDIGY